MSNTERAAGRRFDREHGVTTHAIAFLTDLDPERTGDACAHATHYEAVPVSAFHELLACVPEAFVRRATFVDAGAGMGRAVMLASEYPFKQVVGIDVSAALAEVARENLQRARGFNVKCRDVRIAVADARTYRYPRGPLVLFLFNPFDAQALDAALDALEARDGQAQRYVLYHTPVHEDRLAARGYRELARFKDSTAFVSG